MTLSDEQQLWAYRMMVLIRRFEEKTVELFQQNLMGGSLHLCSGQEAVSVGCCAALRSDDYMTMTYRNRGQFLAKGADPAKTLAEMLGRSTGYCKGKGGPMHLTAPEIGVIGANGIVAAGIPIAVGAALTAKLKGLDRVAMTFFGDGATNQGVFHEALNLASAWDLPIVFVCENNLYSEMTPSRSTTRVERLADRAAAYGFPGVSVDGMDPSAVYDAARSAVERARSGAGPTLIEAKTYRFSGHMLGDNEVYRTRQEVEEWKQRDPILALRRRLLETDPTLEARLNQLDQEVASVVSGAAAWALASPYPSATELSVDIFA